MRIPRAAAGTALAPVEGMHSLLLLAISIPWLRGFTTTTSSELAAAHHGSIQLVAEVADAAGVETIVASYADGLVVHDSAGKVLARSEGFDAAGSADKLLSVSVGDALLGAPVIAVTARIGNKRESSVWFELYRVRGNQLDRLFAAVVEEHENNTDKQGSITLIPGGLVYQEPRGSAADLWLFDPRAGRYMYRGAFSPGSPRRPASRNLVSTLE